MAQIPDHHVSWTDISTFKCSLGKYLSRIIYKNALSKGVEFGLDNLLTFSSLSFLLYKVLFSLLQLSVTTVREGIRQWGIGTIAYT